MKLGAVPENVLERIALGLGIVPTPAIEVAVGMQLSRVLLVATKLGLFDALDGGALAADEVAARCGAANLDAMRRLLDALAGGGYLRARGARYELQPHARKWLTSSSPKTVRDAVLAQELSWDWISRYEQFVRTGEPILIFEQMSSEQHGLFQRAMRQVCGVFADEVARRTPLPRRARDMLDLGGSHGYFSVAMCRRHRALSAIVLDLPQAIAHAAPLLAAEGLGERVRHRAGNAQLDDLGDEAFDLVLVSMLIHCFDEAANRALLERIARALRPGGIHVVFELTLRPDRETGAKGQGGGLSDLYYALTGPPGAGAWSFDAVADWQRAAGLEPRSPIHLLTASAGGLQLARKPVGTRPAR